MKYFIGFHLPIFFYQSNTISPFVNPYSYFPCCFNRPKFSNVEKSWNLPHDSDSFLFFLFLLLCVVILAHKFSLFFLIGFKSLWFRLDELYLANKV